MKHNMNIYDKKIYDKKEPMDRATKIMWTVIYVILGMTFILAVRMLIIALKG